MELRVWGVSYNHKIRWTGQGGLIEILGKNLPGKRNSKYKG